MLSSRSYKKYYISITELIISKLMFSWFRSIDMLAENLLFHKLSMFEMRFIDIIEKWIEKYDTSRYFLG